MKAILIWDWPCKTDVSSKAEFLTYPSPGFMAYKYIELVLGRKYRWMCINSST